MKLPPALLPLFALSSALAAAPPEPKFRGVTIDDKIQIGYGVAVADVDGDRRPDVLLADKRQLVWYQNPGQPPPGAASLVAPVWSKFVIAENLTEKDNVCLAAQDLDGDGKCELAVGAEWNPGDTEKSGAVFYLVPPADRTQRWEPVKFPSVEPTTHRMKWLKLADGKWGLVVVPLHGRGNKNGEGAPVKVLLYHPPADPRAEWKSEVIDESMHLTHNFDLPLLRKDSSPATTLVLAGRETFGRYRRSDSGVWTLEKGIPATLPSGSFPGAGEIRLGHLSNGVRFFATVEPMHGNALVVYPRLTMSVPDRKPDDPAEAYPRHVLADQFADGHALACGDLLGMGGDQIVVGWRGNPKAPRPVGVKLFAPLDATGAKWRESLIDDNEMACEDLVLADLNADGRLDIVAAGRATKNVKIYFNETAR